MPTPSTLVVMYRDRIAQSPSDDAVYGKRKGVWKTLTWSQVDERVRAVAAGLMDLGVELGQRVSILSGTRPEWFIADLAVLIAGGATTTIYPSNKADECAYILDNSDSVVLIAEDDSQVQKVLAVRERCPKLKHIVVLDGSSASGDDVVTWEELVERGKAWNADHPGALDTRGDEIEPGSLACLIYTSGTTGRPKGVQLTHDNFVFTALAGGEIGLLEDGDVQYLFLPLSHIFAKILAVNVLALNIPTAIDGSIDDLIANLPAIQPTMMAAVPRVFEKVYSRVVAGAQEAGGLKYRIFKWALSVGMEVADLRLAKQEPQGMLAFKYRVATRLVFSKIQARFGGSMRGFISGGAPLSPDIAKFFLACDMPIIEGYGMTETTAASFINRTTDLKLGTVGLPLPGVEVKIAEDGEILLGGRGIMRGYHKMPDATAEALVDGWMHTGDIGEIDSDGFLKITDRKKDLIITAGGKNIAPQNIENQLKAASPWISQVVMHGDTRNFCVALICIDEETVGKWAEDNGVDFHDYASLAAHERVRALVWADVEALNATLARHETIKKIALLDHDLSLERGELTPKMSVRRKVVEADNRAVLDAFYEGALAEV